jgi:tetratricopeptide (TPR) repeat protein
VRDPRAVLHRQGTRAENTEAEAFCRRAITIAPGYGRAHSLLAWALLRRAVYSGDLRTVLLEVGAETQTALALDDRDPWAHFAQGMLHQRSRRFGEAARSLRRALELNPNFALAHAYLQIRCHQGAPGNDSAEHALRPARATGLWATMPARMASISQPGVMPNAPPGAQHDREKSQCSGTYLPTASLVMQGI